MSDSTAFHVPRTAEAFRQRVLDNLYHMHGEALPNASAHDAYMALSYTIRDLLVERWRSTIDARLAANPKFVYYLSAEYLPGKQLEQNMLYTGTEQLVREAAEGTRVQLKQMLELDIEPGLGNGGLGRLAACFLDSLATLDMPAVGFGIRYEYGIFKQSFREGWQVEQPDEWLLLGNPWEFAQPDDMVEVGFGGHTEFYQYASRGFRVRWVPAEQVLGEPYTTLVPGYGTKTVSMLRLWRARATEEFDFELFDVGDYSRAVARKVESENITKVLYPNDSTPQGKRLRLKQQYFFVACSLREILRRFHWFNEDIRQLPDKAVVQLNDTHPVVAIPELIRILLDEYGLSWDEAWDISTRTFAYTCHTLLPEALEQWPVDLFGEILPRHLEIIYEINRRLLEAAQRHRPDDDDWFARVSLVDEGGERQIRMAHLATVGSFAVNGVAQLQSRLLRENTLKDLADWYPEKFQNKTNGVSPRRFLRLSNPQLCALITAKIGDGWLNDLQRLGELESWLDDTAFQNQWREVKQANKHRLAEYLATVTDVSPNEHSLFDVMVKRLHEYKRQLLKVMHIIWLRQRLLEDPNWQGSARTFLFGAKAAPGYRMAKLIIKLVNNVAYVVNHDPRLEGRLRVVFPANFNVSMAQVIYPGADISEQISLAGKEASGTGNMKFALNGAVTVGTLDGANIEIRERVGAENFFLFGHTAEEVAEMKRQGHSPLHYYHNHDQLHRVVDAIGDGEFSFGDRELFAPLVESLLYRDEYLLLADFDSYVNCCESAADAFEDEQRWTRMSILNTARCGYFSSDRTITEYCRDIWHLQPVPVR